MKRLLLFTVWEPKSCRNGHEPGIKNIMVMEQLNRFNTFINTDSFNVFFDTEAPFLDMDLSIIYDSFIYNLLQPR